MLHPSTKRLIDKLFEKTAEQAIEWTEGEDNAVVYDTEGYRVALMEEPRDVVLYDPLGKELERATHEDLSGAQAADGQTYADLLSAMLIEAQRIARGAEQAIERVLAGLDKTDKGGALGMVVAPAPEAVSEPEAEPVEAAEPIPQATDETTLISEPDVELAVHRLADEVNNSDPASSAPEEPQEELQPVPLGGIGMIAGFSGTVQVEDAPSEPSPFEPSPFAEETVTPVIEDSAPTGTQIDASPEAIEEANTVLLDPFAAQTGSDVSEQGASAPDDKPAAPEESQADEGRLKTTTRFNPWN